MRKSKNLIITSPVYSLLLAILMQAKRDSELKPRQGVYKKTDIAQKRDGAAMWELFQAQCDRNIDIERRSWQILRYIMRERS